MLQQLRVTTVTQFNIRPTRSIKLTLSITVSGQPVTWSPPPFDLRSCSNPHDLTDGRRPAAARTRAVATQSAPRGPSAGQQVHGPRLLPRPNEVGLGASTPASAAPHTKAQRCNRLQVGALSVAKAEQIEGVRLPCGYIELSHWVQMW